MALYGDVSLSHRARPKETRLYTVTEQHGPVGGSKYDSCSSSMGSVSLCAVRLCMARVEICLYVFPQWLQL